MLSHKKGFTLIELLIVVAIIAILAAIAIPNFLSAQIRAKVSREKNDERTMATAMESYFVDNNVYPKDNDAGFDAQLSGANVFAPGTPEYSNAANGYLSLTTPVAYLTSLLSDPFGFQGASATGVVVGGGAIGYRIGSGSWSYGVGKTPPSDVQGADAVFAQMGPRASYVIIGVGPDRARTRMGYKAFPFMAAGGSDGAPSPTAVNSAGQPYQYMDYDPTNGTVSVGDVYRFGGDWQSGRFLYNGQVIGSQASPGGSVW